MHMQIPKTNALVIPPNSCPSAKIPEDNSIAGMIPILIFNLLNRTPLNINSSRTGAMRIEDNISKSKEDGSITSGSKSGAGMYSGYTKLMNISKFEINATKINANKIFIRNM